MKRLITSLALLIACAHLGAIRLNVNGDVAAGVGGGRMSVNGEVIAQGGSPGWRTASKVVYNGVSAGVETRLYEYDTTTQTITDLGVPAGNVAYAGGNVWARWGSGPRGLITSLGWECAACGLSDVGPDGVVYYNVSRQAGRGLRAHFPDGHEVEVLPTTINTPLSVRGFVGGAVYGTYSLKAGVWRGPAAVTAKGASVFAPVYVLLPTREWWIVYGTQTNIFAQPVGQAVGYKIPTANYYSHDAIAFNGGIRVAYALTQGEQPGQVRTVDLDLHAPRSNLDADEPPPTPTPLDPKATIESYQTPIVVTDTSTAVAKVTQGVPSRFKWFYEDAPGHWTLVADNPASDKDHHYKFSAPGRYAIRLETYNARGEMTDRTGTPRIIEVTPVTPPIPPIPPPVYVPPVPGPSSVVMQVTDVNGRPLATAAAWSQPVPNVVAVTDDHGYATVPMPISGSGVCAKLDGYFSPGLPDQDHTCVLAQPNTTVALRLQPVVPPPPPIQALHTDRRIFRTEDGAAWRYKGVTAFRLLDRFAKGEDITSFLDAYRGYNVLRIFAYINDPDAGKPNHWKVNWEPPTVEVTKAFADRVARDGFYVELCLLTDDDSVRLTWAKDYIAGLTAGYRPKNLLLEAGNEPTTHKNINTAALKSALTTSGYLYASGNYEDSTKFYGTYGTAHTDRDSQWPRRAHDLMEYYNGGGPHKPSDPAHPVPWSGDEPAKLQDVTYAPDDWRGYFGACALLGGGCTFHSETGKYGDLPTPQEKVLIAAALDGLNIYPADAPLGPYSRPNDDSLRTYVVGPWMVRIRPTTPAPKGGGFIALDGSGIFWRRQ